jgi:hypothetical protein
MNFGGIQLALPDLVHGLDADQAGALTPKRPEAHHRPHSALDRPVVLLSDVIQVLRLAHFDDGA